MTKKNFMQVAFRTRNVASVEKKVRGVPVLSPFADWDFYYLRAPLSWRPENPDDMEYDPVNVPAGFVCDLASIPRPFWALLPKTARYTAPAIIHDYLYWFQTTGRQDADRIFDLGMKALGVPRWKRFIIFQSVKWGGGSSWTNNRILRENGERRLLKKYPIDAGTTWQEWKMKKSAFA